MAPSGGGARPGRRVSGGPHPRRGLFRHRRDPRSGRPAAAHAAAAGALRARRLGARCRQRLPRRGLRHGGPLQRGARLVDVPRVRARGRLGPRRRPAALAGGRPSGRERGARDRAGIVHGGGARRHPGPLVRAGPRDPRFGPRPDRGRPPPGALHGRRSGPAPGARARPRSRQPERPLQRRARRWRRRAGRGCDDPPRLCRRRRRPPPARSSRPAGRASPRARWHWPSPRSVPRRWPSTTAPGPSGAVARTRRSKAASPPRHGSDAETADPSRHVRHRGGRGGGAGLLRHGRRGGIARPRGRGPVRRHDRGAPPGRRRPRGHPARPRARQRPRLHRDDRGQPGHQPVGPRRGHADRPADRAYSSRMPSGMVWSSTSPSIVSTISTRPVPRR